MTTAKLYGLDKPDEQADLNLKDANPEELSVQCRAAWVDSVPIFHEDDETLREMNPSFDELAEPLYKQACKIVRPFKESINGTLCINDTPPISETLSGQLREMTIGFYLSAFLNETNLDALLIRMTHPLVYGIGYKLQPNKLVYVENGVHVAGAGRCAEGGIIINRGMSETIGLGASDGVFLNYGNAETMDNSEGGIHINYGNVFRDKLVSVEGGTYISKSLFSVGIQCFGDFIGAIVDDYKHPGELFVKGTNGLLHIAEYVRLRSNKTLRGLLNEVDKASSVENYQRVERSARKVDSHVRENYKPRRFRKSE